MPQAKSRKSKILNATAKQQAFVTVRATGGMTGADTYRAITQSEGSTDAVGHAAHRLLTKPNSQTMIDMHYAEAAQRAPRSVHETRAMLLKRLEDHVADDGPVSLKAIELYGKIPAIDLWQEHGRSEDGDESSDTLRDRLRSKLQGLLNAPAAGDTVLDLVAQVDEPTKPAI